MRIELLHKRRGDGANGNRNHGAANADFRREEQRGYGRKRGAYGSGHAYRGCLLLGLFGLSGLGYGLSSVGLLVIGLLVVGLLSVVSLAAAILRARPLRIASLGVACGRVVGGGEVACGAYLGCVGTGGMHSAPAPNYAPGASIRRRLMRPSVCLAGARIVVYSCVIRIV